MFYQCLELSPCILSQVPSAKIWDVPKNPFKPLHRLCSEASDGRKPIVILQFGRGKTWLHQHVAVFTLLLGLVSVMKYFWNWVFNTQVWTNLTGYLFWWFDFCFVPMGFCWLAFPSQVKKGVSPHEVRRRFDDEAVATKVAVRWVVNRSVVWPLPNVEGIVNSCTWSVSWKLAVHMVPLLYIFL